MAASLPVTIFFFANLCYCLAYLVTDIVWLRILSIIAAVSTFPYFIFQQEVMYSAVFWQSTFVLVNIFHLVLLYRARKPVPLTEQESLVKNMVFRHLTSRETASLLKPAQWHAAGAGEKLVSQDQPLESLYLLYSGKIEIKQNGVVVAHRGPGSFIGEIGFMTGSGASADVCFTESSRYIEWNSQSLKNFLNKKHSLKSAFESLLAVNVANKLGSVQQLLPGLS